VPLFDRLLMRESCTPPAMLRDLLFAIPKVGRLGSTERFAHCRIADAKDDRGLSERANRLHESVRVSQTHAQRLPEPGTYSKEVSTVTAFSVGVFEGDVDSWKERFLSDPLGRKQVAKGHTLLPGADNPNQVFVRLEFDNIQDAKAFAEKVRGSLDTALYIALSLQTTRCGTRACRGPRSARNRPGEPAICPKAVPRSVVAS
jgi:hypothetical protein